MSELRSLRFTPEINQSGITNFTFSVHDDGSSYSGTLDDPQSTSQTIEITIKSVNDKPVRTWPAPGEPIPTAVIQEDARDF